MPVAYLSVNPYYLKVYWNAQPFTLSPSFGSSEERCLKRKAKTTLLTAANPTDYCLLAAGTFSALLHGAALPLLSIVIGRMTNLFLNAQADFGYDQNVSGSRPETVLVQSENLTSSVVICCFYYIAIGFAAFFTSYVQVVSFESFAERLTYELRQHYVRAVLRQELAWFDTQKTGCIAGRLTDDLERVREGIGDKFALLLQAAACCTTGFLIGFWFNWKITAVMLIFTPVIALTTAWIGRTATIQSSIEQDAYAVANSIAQQAFSTIRTVFSLNGSAKEIKRYENALEKCRKTSRIKYLCMGIGYGVISLSTYASYAAAFWFASLMIVDDPTLDRGSIFTVFFAVMSGASALGGVLSHFVTFTSAFGSVKKVLSVIDSVPFIDAYSDSGHRLTAVKGKIAFKSVSFSYPNRANIKVLKNVSFTVKEGEKVAVVGPSGSGKSTLVNLIMRFYDPSSGLVAVDDCDLKTLNVRELRNAIGVVTQEPVLFDGTLESNIRLGLEDINRKDVIAACRQADAWEFIEKLPEGLSTRVGERGVQLSGGQKQRIAIARALIKNPKIIIFDEATSALDSECEAVVQKALEKVQRGRTILTIAHRLSTIKNADEIIVLDKGKIIERGNHDNLIRQNGTYSKMVNAQEISHAQGEAHKIGSVAKAELSFSPQLVPKVEAIRKASFDLNHSGIFGGQDVIVKRSAGLKKIFLANQNSWFFFFLGLLGCCLNGLIQPFFSVLYSQIFSVFSEQPDVMIGDAQFWSLMFLVCGTINFIGSFSGINLTGLCGETVTKKLRMDAFVNVMRQDVAFFDKPAYSSGNLCTRFSTDAPNVRYVFTRLPVVAASAVTLFGAITIAFSFGWQLAFVLLPIIPLVVGSGYFDWKLQAGKRLKGAKLLEKAGKTVVEAVENIRTVQVLNKQTVFYDEYCNNLKKPFQQNMLHAHVYGATFAFSQSLVFFTYAASFYLGSIFVESGIMEPVNVYRVFFAIAFCGQSIGQISSFIPDIVKARIAASEVFHLSEFPTAIDTLSDTGSKKQISGTIVMKDIYFAYPTRPDVPVLSAFSLNVKEGETVALVGASGCGKSTVMALLERFYEPQKGTILIGNESIDEINIQWLRSHMCIVCQEPLLFDASIEDNIIYGLDHTVSHEEVVEASKIANIHEFVMTLPKGYETRVGEKGRQLSGGQKQRIAIARAMLRNPAILLLDEATSALDTESEKAVHRAVENARKGRTCVIIAHRLSTIQSADSIVLMSNGTVVEKGTHSELINQGGIYRTLCEAQELIKFASA